MVGPDLVSRADLSDTLRSADMGGLQKSECLLMLRRLTGRKDYLTRKIPSRWAARWAGLGRLVIDYWLGLSKLLQLLYIHVSTPQLLLQEVSSLSSRKKLSVHIRALHTCRVREGVKFELDLPDRQTLVSCGCLSNETWQSTSHIGVRDTTLSCRQFPCDKRVDGFLGSFAVTYSKSLQQPHFSVVGVLTSVQSVDCASLSPDHWETGMHKLVGFQART